MRLTKLTLVIDNDDNDDEYANEDIEKQKYWIRLNHHMKIGFRYNVASQKPTCDRVL